MVRAKLQYEYRRFREEASWAEFAFWLVGWALLVYALITAKRENMNPQTLLVIQAQSVVTLLLPLFRLLPRELFLARISYRAQTWVMLMVLAAAFVGKFMNIYTLIPRYDMYLHAFGCFFCVFTGYEVAMALKKSPEPTAPVIGAVCGFGLSFFSAVAWEIFEFVCDQFFDGNTQAWNFVPDERYLEILPTDPTRYALLDTMTDLISGTAGSLLGGAALFALLVFKQKHAQRKPPR